jgi:hypothetical protein
MCKLTALCFYSGLVLVDSFMLQNPPERKDRKRLLHLFPQFLINTSQANKKTSKRF